ncbi:hypothetical protein BC834DRAFT_968846 [Gloeopeniophorella convolvens]|nr:hypothetical protein BC834DRAFT_968846 [Gloeopeniophorella convolvens]
MSPRSVRSPRGPPVPLLLSEFPSPPTFIPPSPNPPPSRPPSLPLPPVPGPSPLSEQDLVYITNAARSRRTSRISTSSNSSWRDSAASFASTSSGPSTVPASSAMSTFPQSSSRNRTESLTSISAHSVRSFSSNGSLSVPLPSYATPRAFTSDRARSPPITVAVNEAILEDEELPSVDASEHSLTRTSLADIPRTTPSPRPFARSSHDESISSIDMHDLPALQDDDTTDLDSQALSFHLRMRAARSKSATHKYRISQAATQPRRSTSPTNSERTHSPPPTQHPRSREPSQDAGHASNAFPHMPPPPDDSDRRRQSEGGAPLASRSLLAYVNKRDDDEELWNEESFVEDYGLMIEDGEGDFGIPPDDDEGGDSDSSLDLHTPLPNLMLRDGMLSPHSKLLPQNTRAESPMILADGNRPGSILSVASTTKSGVIKDERDTHQRRVRHRDGRLLKGGIGLTTGLGWSDSEDEGAPSPLTKRLSHLALSRRSSASSLSSTPRSSRSHPHPLSRSFSAEGKSGLLQSSQKTKGRPSLPPTSWPKRAQSGSSTLSLSIPEHGSPEQPSRSQARFSEPSSSSVDTFAESQSHDQVVTPSSSSTQSLLGPVTPDATDVLYTASLGSWDRDKSLPPIPLSRGPSVASLRPKASSSDMKSGIARPSAPLSSRPISSGSEVSDASAPALLPHTPKTPRMYATSTLPTARTPRPLQLSASLGAGMPPGEKPGSALGYNRRHDPQRARALSGPPSAHAHAGTLRYNARPPSLPTASGLPKSGSTDSVLSEQGVPVRPRTGTGMVYKKSASNLTRAAASVQAQSRLRMPTERSAAPAAV